MSERRPLGIPISRAILLPPGVLGELLQPVLAAVDRVHGDGKLPQITVVPVPSLEDESSYRRVEPFGIPWDIAMRPSAPQPGLNLVHEIGHLPDHQSIGTPGVFASPEDDLFEQWRNAIEHTEATATLRLIEQTSRNPRVIDYARYQLQTVEQWARSYAQFVAIRSGESRLIDELRQRQRDATASGVPVQWSHDDFRPVAASIADLFRALEWTT